MGYIMILGWVKLVISEVYSQSLGMSDRNVTLIPPPINRTTWTVV